MGKWISWLGSPLLMALLSGALYWLAYLNGHSDGKRQCAEDALASVQEQLATYSTQLAKAEAASIAHLAQWQQSEKSHEQSTRTLRRALAESQGLRADCRLSASLMQQLEAARLAAARAATGGAGSAMPAAGSP